ncbi:MAG: alpha/beta fold hydrolase [Propionibacteriales bacterium]|nr:alpha/beta fold hydrolase [Propionibacteriales bacterium]
MTTQTVPQLRGGLDRSRADSAVLVLHGGREHATMATSPFQLSYLRMLDMYAGLRRQSQSCAVYLLRYRVRGWNPGHGVPDPVLDARWALEQISARHGEVPVGLLGHSMGARVAFAVAGNPQVVGVCGLAPWLPQHEPLPPVRTGVRYVIAHGTSDRMTSPPLSKIYAMRLRAAGNQVARFEFEGGKHALLDQPVLWHQFAVRTTLGLVGDRALPPAIASALDDERAPDFTMALDTALAAT